MALIDVLKYTPNDDTELVWKFPSSDLKLGTQVIVNEGQEAIFVKSGVALDIFKPGTYTLTTGNIPLLNKIINLPFGGDTPFSAEVWFINTTVKRDLKWGTSTPILLRDSLIGMPVNVRAFGRWGLKVSDSRSFLTQITGAKIETSTDKIREYFTGEVIQKLSSVISAAIVKEKISVVDINAYLNELSKFTIDNIKQEFEKYGIDVVNFNIENVNLLEEDAKKYQEKFESSAEVLAARVNNVDFNTVKSFEILQKAAENQSAGNGLGAMMNAGIGLGVGLPIGQQLGQNININPQETNPSSSIDDPMQKLKKLKMMLDEGLITPEIFESKRDQIMKDL
jgi:membrane protease subunit (stomatin/prohibitin family)